MSDLREIPGVGPRTEADMHAIGIRCTADLVGREPEELYRLVVYWAENPVREAEKLKWWYWKNVPYRPKGEQV